MTGTPPFECGPDCPAPDHRGVGPRASVSGLPAVHTGNSTQAQLIEATAHDVAVLKDIKDMYLADGWPEHAAESRPVARGRAAGPRRRAGRDRLPGPGGHGPGVGDDGAGAVRLSG